MEFYVSFNLRLKFSQIVSIPNGMEFYTDIRFNPIFIREFQFPTGWNSTILIRSESNKINVSIPNGMEFYPVYGLTALF